MPDVVTSVRRIASAALNNAAAGLVHNAELMGGWLQLVAKEVAPPRRPRRKPPHAPAWWDLVGTRKP